MESICVVANSSGRLDKILSEVIKVSRNQVEKLIKEGYVTVDGKSVVKGSFKVKEGQEICYSLPKSEVLEFEDVDFDIEILYEDDDVLVLNKPAGLVVHPAPSVKEATLVDWLRKKGVRLSTISGEERNGIVHRLDKDTTGAILVAKNNFAHDALSRQLQDRSMGRYYLAVINHPLKENLIVNKPIARNPKNRLKMAIVDGGRESKTAFAKIALSDNGHELVAMKLFSGRTHQIRVHLTALGRYILGDKLYGAKSCKHSGGMLLHAYILYFLHPQDGRMVEIKAPLQIEMKSYIQQHFDKEILDEKLENEQIKSCFNFIDN